MKANEMSVVPVTFEPLESRLLMDGTADPTAGFRAAPTPDENNGAVDEVRRYITGSVSNATSDRDYVHQFSINVPVGKLYRKFKLKMYGMTGDADIDLLRGDGTLMVSGEKWGLKAESISASLATGTYYLRPHISSYFTWTVSTNYTLMVSAK